MFSDNMDKDWKPREIERKCISCRKTVSTVNQHGECIGCVTKSRNMYKLKASASDLDLFLKQAAEENPEMYMRYVTRSMLVKYT